MEIHSILLSACNCTEAQTDREQTADLSQQYPIEARKKFEQAPLSPVEEKSFILEENAVEEQKVVEEAPIVDDVPYSSPSQVVRAMEREFLELEALEDNSPEVIVEALADPIIEEYVTSALDVDQNTASQLIPEAPINNNISSMKLPQSDTKIFPHYFIMKSSMTDPTRPKTLRQQYQDLLYWDFQNFLALIPQIPIVDESKGKRLKVRSNTVKYEGGEHMQTVLEREAIGAVPEQFMARQQVEMKYKCLYQALPASGQAWVWESMFPPQTSAPRHITEATVIIKDASKYMRLGVNILFKCQIIQTYRIGSLVYIKIFDAISFGPKGVPYQFLALTRKIVDQYPMNQHRIEKYDVIEVEQALDGSEIETYAAIGKKYGGWKIYQQIKLLMDKISYIFHNFLKN